MIISAPTNLTLLCVLWASFFALVVIGIIRSLSTKKKIQRAEKSLVAKLLAIAHAMDIEVRYDSTIGSGVSKTLLGNAPEHKDLILIGDEKIDAGDLSTVLCCQIGAILYHLYLIHEQLESNLQDECTTQRNAAVLALLGVLMGPSLKHEHKVILSAYFEVFGLDGEAINRNKDVIRYVTINLAGLMGLTKDPKCTVLEDRKQAYANK